jgi:hypothetical protein
MINRVLEAEGHKISLLCFRAYTTDLFNEGKFNYDLLRRRRCVLILAIVVIIGPLKWP